MHPAARTHVSSGLCLQSEGAVAIVKVFNDFLLGDSPLLDAESPEIAKISGDSLFCRVLNQASLPACLSL